MPSVDPHSPSDPHPLSPPLARPSDFFGCLEVSPFVDARYSRRGDEGSGGRKLSAFDYTVHTRWVGLSSRSSSMDGGGKTGLGVSPLCCDDFIVLVLVLLQSRFCCYYYYYGGP